MRAYAHLFILAIFLLHASPVAQDTEKILRVGIIGLDTSHVVAFTRVMNDPAAEGPFARVQVTHAFPGGSPDIAASRDRIEGFTARLAEMGVEIVESIPSLLEKVDAVMLESVDGRLHLRQLLPVLAARKPVFIDKPMAGSLQDCLEIHRLAKEQGVPCFTSSSLRFGPGILAMREKVGKVLGCDAFGPCTIEEHHPDLYWYGIHGVEILFTIMGPGCVSVRRTQTAGHEQVTGAWEDGRIGTFRGLREGKKGYGAMVFGTKGIERSGPHTGYQPLVTEIAKFFVTGHAPVPLEESLEIYAFMEAADESKRQGGRPVTIASVIEKARIAPAKRALAAYRANWHGIETATLRIEDKWFTDVIPPGGGLYTFESRLRGDGVSWKLDKKHDHGPKPKGGEGSKGLDEGRGLFVDSLKQLDAAGLFDLSAKPGKIDPPGTIYFAGHTYTLSLRLEGAPGLFESQWKLVPGAGSKQLNTLLRRFFDRERWR